MKSNHDAADVVQLVFTKWWEKGEGLIIRGDVRPYLYRTVHNQCLNLLRNRKNRKTDSVDFGTVQMNIPTADSEDRLVKKEIAAKLMVELNNLPPQCKLIFFKSRFEEKKYSEIAMELHLSIKTVETQIGKALKILREKLHGENINMIVLITFLLKSNL